MTTKIRPFSTGTQYIDWQDANCCRCQRGGEDGQGVGCEIADALGEACIGDGEVSEDIARRMGHTLFPDYYNWPCTEFRSEETGAPHAAWLALLGQKQLPLEVP